MTTDEHAAEVHSLHRYFVTADLVRKHYDDRVAGHCTALPDQDDWATQWSYLSLWYATLYVVVEGWQELHLKNPAVQGLLDAPDNDVKLLKRYRNGTFHFQKQYGSSTLSVVRVFTPQLVWARSQ